MKRSKLYIFVVSILLLLVLVVLWFFGINEDVSEDSLMFKRDYEAYNIQSTYEKVAIEKSNKAKYSSLSEINDTIKNGTGLIFIGMPNNHESRLLAEILVNLTTKSEIEEFLYLDLTNLRSEFKFQDEELVKTNETSDDYNKLLSLLDSYLDYYSVTINEKRYIYREKYIEVPILIGVNDGKIVGVIEETFEESAIEELIDSVLKNNAVCDEAC